MGYDILRKVSTAGWNSEDLDTLVQLQNLFEVQSTFSGSFTMVLSNSFLSPLEKIP